MNETPDGVIGRLKNEEINANGKNTNEDKKDDDNKDSDEIGGFKGNIVNKKKSHSKRLLQK